MNTDPLPDRNFDQGYYDQSVANSTSDCVAEFEVYGDGLYRLPRFTEAILVGGHILVMIFSGCGNIAALIVIVKSKAPKLSTKYFLIMLALSDLLMTIAAPPLNIAKIMTDFNEWIFGKLLCSLFPFFQFLSATMSAACLMAIAVERNFLIVRAMSASTSIVHLWQTWILPIIQVAIILLPVACALPQLWSYAPRYFHAIPTQPLSSSTTVTPGSTTTTTSSPVTSSPSCDIRSYCYRNDFDKRNVIYWSVTGTIYILLLLCFLVSYISIYKFVKKHGQFKRQIEQDYSSTTTTTTTSPSSTIHIISHNNNNSGSPPQNKSKLAAAHRHRKTLKLILGLILLHLCCRAPNWIYQIVINVKVVKTNELTLTLLESFHLLSTVNCALDPFLYVIWNHSLRANREEKGDGGAGGNKGGSSVLCKKTGNVFHSIFCFCCKYKRESVDGHISVDPVLYPTSTAWLRKSPKVYHVSSDDNWENKQTVATNNRYSEKSTL